MAPGRSRDVGQPPDHASRPPLPGPRAARHAAHDPGRRRPDRRAARRLMQIGFNLPNSGPFSKVNEMTRLAVEGEAMGFDYLTVTDHVVLPDTRVPGYPYSEDGAFYEEAPLERHEQLMGMAWFAARTSRFRRVAPVLVVPHRPAVLAAKMLATLDVLSGGRLVVGIGAGWLKAEFDAVVGT